MLYDVLIVGGGFAGTATARRLTQKLRGRSERVLLVSPENFLTFTPLLPEAASGTLEPRHAVVPLRQLLPRTDVLAGSITSLDIRNRHATVDDANGERHEVHYRFLVLAPGSTPTTFSIPGLVEHAVGFKTLPDAIWLRNRVLRQLEAAEATEDLELRRKLLTFTFVGAGYAGVEAIAELESLARDAVATYPSLQRRDLRWILVEATDGILPGLDRRLAKYSERQLRRRGVEIYLSTTMESCEGGKVLLSDDRLPPFCSDTIVWTAGQRPSALPAKAGLPVDDRGRVPVDAHLRTVDVQDVWVIGDAAAVPDPDGGTCPATAQHALRQGLTAGTNVAAALGVGRAKPFTYRNRGLAVTLGKHRGTAQVRRLVFTGPLAWWMGRSYHLWMLPGAARRLRIVSDWTLSLLFPRDVSQLGALGSPTPLPPPPEDS